MTLRLGNNELQCKRWLYQCAPKFPINYTILQRELLLTMFYNINSSPFLLAKLCQQLFGVIITNSAQCLHYMLQATNRNGGSRHQKALKKCLTFQCQICNYTQCMSFGSVPKKKIDIQLQSSFTIVLNHFFKVLYWGCDQLTRDTS